MYPSELDGAGQEERITERQLKHDIHFADKKLEVGTFSKFYFIKSQKSPNRCYPPPRPPPPPRLWSNCTGFSTFPKISPENPQYCFDAHKNLTDGFVGQHGWQKGPNCVIPFLICKQLPCLWLDQLVHTSLTKHWSNGIKVWTLLFFFYEHLFK